MDDSTQDPPQDQDPAGGPHPDQPSFEATGHSAVDRVLGTLVGIEQREVHEHVAVFEEVHAALRRALDGTLEDPSDAAHG